MEKRLGEIMYFFKKGKTNQTIDLGILWRVKIKLDDPSISRHIIIYYLWRPYDSNVGSGSAVYIVWNVFLF